MHSSIFVFLHTAPYSIIGRTFLAPKTILYIRNDTHMELSQRKSSRRFGQNCADLLLLMSAGLHHGSTLGM